MRKIISHGQGRVNEKNNFTRSGKSVRKIISHGQGKVGEKNNFTRSGKSQ